MFNNTHNARLYKEAQQRLKELTLLFDASAAISASLEVDKVLEITARRITDALAADECTISIWEPEQNRIVVLQDYSPTPDSLGTVYHLADLPATLQVLTTRQPMAVHISDPDADPAEVALLKKQGDKSLLMVPMVVRDKSVGLIELFHTSEERSFTPTNVALCQTLANQAAAALENARLFQQAQQTLETLDVRARYQAHVAQAAALLAEKGTRAFSKFLSLLGKAAEVSRVCYFETLQDGDGLYWRQAAEWCAPGVRPQINNPDLQHVAASFLPFWAARLQGAGAVSGVVRTMPSPEKVILKKQDIQSTLALAVPGELAVPGFIGFDEMRYEREWDDEETAILQTAATTLANTLARERLMAQLQARAERERLVRSITDKVRRATNTQAIMQTTLRELSQMLGASQSIIRLGTPEQLQSGAEAALHRRPGQESSYS